MLLSDLCVAKRTCMSIAKWTFMLRSGPTRIFVLLSGLVSVAKRTCICSANKT